MTNYSAHKALIYIQSAIYFSTLAAFMAGYAIARLLTVGPSPPGLVAVVLVAWFTHSAVTRYRIVRDLHRGRTA